MDERPGDSVRRDLAVSALVFLAFASDDGDVNDRSLSRLETLLEDEEDWPLYLQMTTVDSLADLVIGHNGFKEKHDGQWMNFGIRSSDREDALEFLMDSFEDQNPELRYHTISALGRILRAEPSLETCPYNICDEDVRKNLEEWEQGREVKQVLPANADPNAVESGAYGPESKMVPIDERQEWQEEFDDLKQIAWKALEDLLEDSEVSLLNQSRIVRWAAEVQNFSMLPEMEESFQESMVRWAENEDIPSSIRQLLKASQERVTLYGVPAAKDPVPSKSAYFEGLDASHQNSLKHIWTFSFNNRLEDKNLVCWLASQGLTIFSLPIMKKLQERSGKTRNHHGPASSALERDWFWKKLMRWQTWNHNGRSAESISGISFYGSGHRRRSILPFVNATGVPSLYWMRWYGEQRPPSKFNANVSTSGPSWRGWNNFLKRQVWPCLQPMLMC